MADLVEWLTAQLDAVEREADRDEPGCNCRDLGCHHTEAKELLARTVAAHRAILAAHPLTVYTDEEPSYVQVLNDHLCPGEQTPCLTLRLLAAIYESRPGYDSAWAVET